MADRVEDYEVIAGLIRKAYEAASSNTEEAGKYKTEAILTDFLFELADYFKRTDWQEFHSADFYRRAGYDELRHKILGEIELREKRKEVA